MRGRADTPRLSGSTCDRTDFATDSYSTTGNIRHDSLSKSAPPTAEKRPENCPARRVVVSTKNLTENLHGRIVPTFVASSSILD
ncbi:MAG: hypothetical protein Fues2KO_52530 [Fuerstiella sp.]